MKIKILIFFIPLFFIAISCEGQNKKPKNSETKNKKMEEKNPNENKQISALKNSMLEYMEMSNPAYSKNDVEECEKILYEYISEISNSKSKDEGMKIVKNTVEKLNKLNVKCNSQLIETSEREQIAEIIIKESSKKGYNKPEEDITENWREW